ncbi:MAG TPA: aminoglycoside phosphotransferase family protein [Polyangiaceae bacterium]|nr:aminoglycoside phosphotransferase family protein [Polyangiaceae bacterium]
MYLTEDSALPYLLQRGIISARDLVRGDIFVSPSDLKRPVFRVSRPDGSGFIVKQPSPLDKAHVRMLDREAAFFDLVRTEPWARQIRPLVPRVRAYDRGVHVLVVEQVPHDTAWNHLRLAAANPVLLGKILGRAIARTHVRLPAKGAASRFLSTKLPWVLELNSKAPEQIHEPGTRAVLELMRENFVFSRALLDIERDFRAETLIHGDAKLDNVLFRAEPRPRAWLIDWAFSGVGDPAWDVGSMIQSALLLWFLGVPLRRDEPFEHGVGRATFPFSLVTQYATMFVRTYLDVRALAARERRWFVRRCARFAGAALAQSALADSRSHPHFTTRQLAMLQMSSRMLEHPEEAAAELLGDPE